MGVLTNDPRGSLLVQQQHHQHVAHNHGRDGSHEQLGRKEVVVLGLSDEPLQVVVSEQVVNLCKQSV